MREIKACPSGKWEHMPTEELDRVLQAELRKEYPDENVVLPILREIENRESCKPVENTPELQAIREQLSKHDTYTDPNKRTRAWITSVAAIAAVLCIVVMALPKTVGAESIMEVLYRWTSSVFEFIDPDDEESKPKIDDGFSANNTGLQQLYDKLTELGVSKDVVPTWLPEGFVLTELKEPMFPDGTGAHGKFVNGNVAVLITYRIATDISPQVEKEDLGIEMVDIGGIAHFIVENEGNFSVTWTVEGVACLLNANVAKEELYAILKSIYRSELPQ